MESVTEKCGGEVGGGVQGGAQRALPVEKQKGKAPISGTQETLSKRKVIPKLLAPWPTILIITRGEGNSNSFLIIIPFAVCQYEISDSSGLIWKTHLNPF